MGVGCDGGRDRKKRKGQRGQGEKGKKEEERFNQTQKSGEFSAKLQLCDFMEVLLL